ncbi:MAG: hypothetical protein WC624_05875 [Candidatus Margulisiibacteriota bacterium]
MGLANIASRFVEGKINQYRLLGTNAGINISFSFNGQKFNAAVYDISQERFSRLGFARSSFVPGVKAYVLDEDTFRIFCRTTDASKTPIPDCPKTALEIPFAGQKTSAALDHLIVGAVYPLSRRGDLDAVRRGELSHLPAVSRNIVLRKGFSEVELAHELLHDIYLGRLFSPEMRRAFTLLVIDQVKKAYAENDRTALKFFKGVSARCKNKLKIEELIKLNTFSLKGNEEIGPNLSNFVGECFVYAWELILGYDNPDLGEGPAELKIFLDDYPVNKPSAPRPEPTVLYPSLPAYPV